VARPGPGWEVLQHLQVGQLDSSFPGGVSDSPSDSESV